MPNQTERCQPQSINLNRVDAKDPCVIVPEPAPLGLFGIGLLAMALTTRKIVRPAGGNGLACGAGCLFDTSGCSATQYEDTGLGTVIDHVTGLEWEKKTASNVNDVYFWEDAFAYVHGSSSDSVTPPSGAVQGTGGHTDWRLPSHIELQTILDCAFSPCIDPVFGPTPSSSNWSSSTFDGDPDFTWVVSFSDGSTFNGFKTGLFRVRAVRGGS